MLKSILGKKVGMTSIFDEKGKVTPITVIEAGPMTVVQVKTPETDGYAAVQFGFGEKKQQRANKAQLGHLKKANVSPKRNLRELEVPADKLGDYTPGKVVSIADLGFNVGDFVDVVGKSIGKGMAGVMKRYHFKGHPATHGAHEYKRHMGSAGTNTSPGRILKGKKMPGHMGAERVTVQNLKVVEVRPEENLIFVRGAVPGHKNGVLTVQFAKKKALKKKA